MLRAAGVSGARRFGTNLPASGRRETGALLANTNLLRANLDHAIFALAFIDGSAAGLTRRGSNRGDYHGNLTIDTEDIDVLRLKVPRTGDRVSDSAGAFDPHADRVPRRAASERRIQGSNRQRGL